MYEWIKAFHIIAVIAWLAGMLYLPRLFVYHCGAEKGSIQSETFKTMERRLLRDRVIPSLWLPPTLTIPEQMGLVIAELHLTLRESRCMACGGELRHVPKEDLRDRIPPKTWRWLDEYFLCTKCDQLFWRGTHWQRIRDRLSKLFEKDSESV